MKRSFAATLLGSIVLTACRAAATPAAASAPSAQAATAASTSARASQTLTVYAAASLSQAFGEMGQAFEAANPGVRVKFNFAAAQTLQGQIAQGAPADVFASASGTIMDAAVTGGFVDRAAPQVFVTNSLVVILPPDNPSNVQSLADLAKAGLKVVLADAAVPAGKYARQVLDNMTKDPSFGADFEAQVEANVVSNETDVKQVVAKVQLGEADAGMVYVSDSVAAPGLKTIEIPDSLNVIAKYPIAPLKKSDHPDLAIRFIGYVLSADGQATLKKWGFTPIN